jgi:DNA invertase Pin-like site-specific DNA recombinase
VVVIYAKGPNGNSLLGYTVARDWEDIQVVTDADMLMKLVRVGKVEIVLASNLNGLGRSVPGLVQVLRDFAAHKVALIVPGRINTSNVSSKVFLDVLDSIAEFKHSAAVEAIHEGLAAAKACGVRLGRPVKVAAYRR